MSAHAVDCILCGAEHGFDVIPGEPARGPSYSSGGEPGCGPEIDWRKRGCGCRDSDVVDHDAYEERMEERALAEAYR